MSLLFKTIKSTPFFKISCLCGVLHFRPFFFLEVKRLKLSTNYSISSLIAFQCLHPNKDVLLSSLSLTCLFTLLFWGFFCRVRNYLVLVSFDIFLISIFHYVPYWLYPLCRNPNLAKCGGEAQHLEKLGIWSPPGLPNV